MQMMEHIVLAKPCENQREEFVTKSQRNVTLKHGIEHDTS